MYVYCIYKATLNYTFIFVFVISFRTQASSEDGCLQVETIRHYVLSKTIEPHFQNGVSLENLRDQIGCRPISILGIPMISVKFLPDGSYLSLDNRRLWVFKELEYRGVINFIHVKRIYSIPGRKWGYMDYVTTVRGYQDQYGDRCYNYCTNYDNSYDDICSQINCWHI